MIRDIRSLQSTDQSRLRDDHKPQAGGDSFARLLQPEDEAAPNANGFTERRKPMPAPSLIRNDAMWTDFFARLGNQPVNDSAQSAPLFNWGEARENARRHAQTARQSALLHGEAMPHLLNKKI